MPPRPAPSRIAQALEYLQGLKSGVGEFVGGVGSNLADRAKAAGGLAYEALTSDPNIGRMTTAEFSQAAADRAPTPRLDQAAQDIGTIGRAIVTQPVQTGKAMVRGEFNRVKEAMASPQAAGQYAGAFVDPLRLAKLLGGGAPDIAELDVYHGTPHRFPGTEANPLGEFDASKIGTGEGAQMYGHGVYLAETPEVASMYRASVGPKDGRLFDLPDGTIKGIATMIAAKGDEGEKVARKLWASSVDDIDEAVRLAREAVTGKSSLYKADLPDEMIDRMLDWDKPLSEQSAAVREALTPENLGLAYTQLPNGNHAFVNASGEVLGNLQAGGTAESFRQNWLRDVVKGSGGDIYKQLGQGINNSKKASDAMRQAGIPGIRYLDEGSRNTAGKWIAKHPQGGETAFNTETELNAFLKRNPEMAAVKPKQTRNFVVFPGEEKKVRILERNGQPAPERIAQALEAAPDYRMGHRPMTVEGGAARLDNAYEAFGEDIYGPNALRYFGGSDPRESGTVAALKRLRDNPDAEVTIYRGVPTDAKGGITKGDWVTLDKSAAQEYAELKPGQKGKVLAMKVKAKDVTTWPDSLLEFGYYPAD